jgi:hypothetical protein
MPSPCLNRTGIRLAPLPCGLFFVPDCRSKKSLVDLPEKRIPHGVQADEVVKVAFAGSSPVNEASAERQQKKLFDRARKQRRNHQKHTGKKREQAFQRADVRIRRNGRRMIGWSDGFKSSRLNGRSRRGGLPSGARLCGSDFFGFHKRGIPPGSNVAESRQSPRAVLAAGRLMQKRWGAAPGIQGASTRNALAIDVASVVKRPPIRKAKHPLMIAALATSHSTMGPARRLRRGDKPLTCP